VMMIAAVEQRGQRPAVSQYAWHLAVHARRA
jgi:hypothetical protein